jgi:hypothetical protein
VNEEAHVDYSPIIPFYLSSWVAVSVRKLALFDFVFAGLEFWHLGHSLFQISIERGVRGMATLRQAVSSGRSWKFTPLSQVITPASCFSTLPHKSFKPPVTLSTTPLGPGPTPNTVHVPPATCVLPASLTTRAQRPSRRAAWVKDASSFIPPRACRAIFA